MARAHDTGPSIVQSEVLREVARNRGRLPMVHESHQLFKNFDFHQRPHGLPPSMCSVTATREVGKPRKT